jgi:hypothetical protein
MAHNVLEGGVIRVTPTFFGESRDPGRMEWWLHPIDH